MTSAVGRALRNVPELNVVGVSTTGSANKENVVLGAGFFDGYEDVDWRLIFDQEFPTKRWIVRVTNDGRAAAWGTFLEDAIGAGANLAHFVVGTGIGGGIVLDSHLLHGAHNFAGALGHVKVSCQHTAVCVCGRQGCVELFASGQAILRYAMDAGVPLSRGSIPEVASLAQAGAEAAQFAFRTAGTWLGKAIASVVNVFDPDFVTIGGGVIAAAEHGDAFKRNWCVEAAAESARATALPRIAARVRIVKASLMNDAALIGIAALASQHASSTNDLENGRTTKD